MTKLPSEGIDHDRIVDHIYEIALEPSRVEDFIDLWDEADFVANFTNVEGANRGEFDVVFQAHLERAGIFLQQGEISSQDLADHLKPYEHFAAFIVNASRIVEAANPGAVSIFAAIVGCGLSQLAVPHKAQTALARLIDEVVAGKEGAERLLKVNSANKEGTVLFRVLHLPGISGASANALVVSTEFHWRESIGDTLNRAFNLTEAEQSVVRLLVEGQTVKAIAQTRGTSVGTVRAQIKSIISKTNLPSQSDIIRLVVTLAALPGGSEMKEDSEAPTISVKPHGWLDAEVWKPFKSLTLPDGRILAYHDMGPPTGNPVLFSHMGSCMVRWSRSMIRLAFQSNLRVICPIRAGYAESDRLGAGADVFAATASDTAFLLKHLNIARLPYAVQGSDFPFAVDFIARNPGLISALIGIGGRPCLPGGVQIEGAGRWQRFFLWAARNNPSLVQFASNAVMSMSWNIGPEAMLRQLCKDSPADLAILENEEMREILAANIQLIARGSANAAGAFAMEYVAFQDDWSGRVLACRNIPVHVSIAAEDPTVDVGSIPDLQAAYPWISFTIIPNAGLALMYQKYEELIPLMATTARDASNTQSEV